MFCQYCGAELPESAAFCKKCGKQTGSSTTGVSQQNPVVQPMQQVAGIQQSVNGVGAGSPELKKKRSAKILAVAVVAVIAVAIVVLVGGLSGGGKSSEEKLANELTSLVQTAFDEEMTEDSVMEYATGMLDLMPPQAMETLMKEADVESEEELAELLGDSLGYMGVGSLSESMDKIEMVFTFYPSDSFDNDEIDDLQEGIDDLDIDMEVEDARHLGLEVNVTALEDDEDLGLEAGEEESEEMETTGLVAIQCDGSWYLWMD